MRRRAFLTRAGAGCALTLAEQLHSRPAARARGVESAGDEARAVPAGRPLQPPERLSPGRIVNEYSRFEPGEREALETSPELVSISGETVTARLPGGASAGGGALSLKVG